MRNKKSDMDDIEAMQRIREREEINRLVPKPKPEDVARYNARRQFLRQQAAILLRDELAVTAKVLKPGKEKNGKRQQ
jgi:hypothetical protein